MADNDSLVKDLIQTVQDLSQRLIPRSETINNEVSRLFGRGRDVKPSSTSTNPAADSNGAAHNEVLSRFRRLNNNRRIGQSLIPKRRKPKQPNTTPFMCDVILLSGPKDSIVPRQGVKLALAERGHVLTGCRFHKAMTEVNVETAIHEAFGSIIPLLVDIEILHSVHNALLKPVLSPGQQGIDGAILHRLFKVKNKPIYVRPSKIIVPELAQENEAEKSKDQLSFNVVEDTDNEDSDDVLTPVLLNSSTQVPSSSNGSQPTLASMSTLARTSTATSHPTLASTSTATSQSTLASTSAATSQSTLASTSTATSQSTLASTSTATSQSTLASTSTATSQSTLASTSTATSQSTLASTSAATSQSTLASTSTATNTPHHVTQATPDYSQDVPDFVDISADDDTMDMTVKEVVIFRSNIRKDVLEVFSDPAILRCHLCVTVMDAAGRAEKGIGKGVILDVLTQFWQDFFLGLAVGGKEKIPYIRHDLQSPQWQSVARVLVYGYNKLSYFPLALSKLFLCTCLFGEDAITPEFLLSSFKDYIPSADQEVLDNNVLKRGV